MLSASPHPRPSRGSILAPSISKRRVRVGHLPGLGFHVKEL
jgi:hypothetical protein